MIHQRLQRGLRDDIKLRTEAKYTSVCTSTELRPYKHIPLQISAFQNLKEGFKPKIKRMQNLAAPKTIHISESGVGLLTHNTSEYEMGRLHRPESFVTPSTNEA